VVICRVLSLLAVLTHAVSSIDAEKASSQALTKPSVYPSAPTSIKLLWVYQDAGDDKNLFLDLRFNVCVDIVVGFALIVRLCRRFALGLPLNCM
jgi:hypothetical protein